MKQETKLEDRMTKQRGKVETRKGSIELNWTRIDRNEPVTTQPNWQLRDKGEEVAMRDLEKPIQQLLADIHEAHQMREEDLANADKPETQPRDPALLILFTLARTSSMMANVALSNEKTNKRLIYLTWVLIVLTVAILILTWLLYKHGQQNPI